MKSAGFVDFAPQRQVAKHFKIYTSTLLLLSPSHPPQQPRSEQA